MRFGKKLNPSHYRICLIETIQDNHSTVHSTSPTPSMKAVLCDVQNPTNEKNRINLNNCSTTKHIERTTQFQSSVKPLRQQETKNGEQALYSSKFIPSTLNHPNRPNYCCLY